MSERNAEAASAQAGNATHKSGRGPARRVLDFLGSMTLAITLLMAVAVASAVGTILQQNQPYQDYLINFGPFWFEIFKSLGLFDVYSAGWFLFILAFLIISTGVCVIRNAPSMLRETRQFRTGVQDKSLRAMKNSREMTVDLPAEDVNRGLETYLGSRGYRLRSQASGDRQVVAARKGTLNRWGYIFTHVAIVVICIGGLMDGRLPLKIQEMTGDLKVETRDLPASEVPEISRIDAGNPSFRGNVNISEGSRASVLFLGMRDGYVVQELPFTIEVKDFRIEHYDNGQPKSYESDIVVHDPEHLDQPLEQTISVNHPLIYRGHAIYQASFADGGTKVDLRAWQLAGDVGRSNELQGRVFGTKAFKLGEQGYRLEIEDFRAFNINPVQGPDGETEQVNFGPNIRFKIRDEAGQAREYENYMMPVQLDGRRVFISGMRQSVGDSFRYVHIPADPQGSMETFMAYLDKLHDETAMRDIVNRTVGPAMLGRDDSGQLSATVAGSMMRLVNLFNEGGYDAVGRDVEEKVPEGKRDQVFEAYVKVLQTVLLEAYLEVLREQGVDVQAMDEETWGFHQQFLEDAVTAINGLAFYGSPIFVQMTDFEHIQAAGLQINKSPGKNVVYFGSVLLTLGVFLLFYVPQRRLWFRLRESDGRTEVLAAGSTNRRSMDFSKEFQSMCEELGTKLGEFGSNSTSSRSG